MKIVTNNKSIQFVIDNHLCTSCGACAGVCNNSAIIFMDSIFGITSPIVNEKKCINCGLCVQVCPGYSFNYYEHQHRLFDELPHDAALGAYRTCSVVYAKDKEILEASQSGGFVSSLLIAYLENGIIDGAIVSRRKTGHPFEVETVIARNRTEILSSVGSIYNAVPAAAIISQVLSTPGKFAFVGTPCQIQGMRKAESIYSVLEKRILLYIGLHCLGVFTNHFYEQILSKAHLKKDEVLRFRHRDKKWRGWPCDMMIEKKDHRIKYLSANVSRLLPRPYYTNWRCQLCFDKANEFSDISCGDCRIKRVKKIFSMKGYDLKNGLSEVVARTERGNKALEFLVQNKILESFTVTSHEICSSIGVVGKKIGLNTFIEIADFFGLGVPKYGIRYVSPNQLTPKKNIIDFIISTNYLFFYKMNRFPAFRHFMKIIPHYMFGIQSVLNIYCTRWGRMTKTSKIDIIQRND